MPNERQFVYVKLTDPDCMATRQFVYQMLTDLARAFGPAVNERFQNNVWARQRAEDSAFQNHGLYLQDGSDTNES